MQKKKILYLITKGTWGGAQRYVFDLATHLPPDIFDVVVACGSNGILTGKLQSAGIRSINVPSLQRDIGIFREIFAFYGLMRLLNNERPDIIHLNSSKAAFLGALAFRIFLLLNFLAAKSYKLKAVFTAHGWPFKEPRSRSARACIFLASYLTALLSNQTIVLSEGDLALAKNMPGIGKKCSLVYNGIERSHPLSRTESREKLGLPPETNMIGTIAELNHNKGVATLVNALPLLSKDIQLCLLGDGDDRKKLEALALTRGVKDRVLFAGNRDNASSYLSAFDIFVLPALKEGLPYTILEAGEQGLPVVGSDISGIRDIINTPLVGILVPPGNPKALAEALKTLLEQPATRSRLGHNLKARIEQAFSFETMLKKTLSVYERA